MQNINDISGRIKPLDGLRGIAVLLVIGFHYLNNQYSAVDIQHLNSVEKIVMKATSFGWCGVDLFFVLSGFLIGSILLKNRASNNYFSTFYIRRFFRIVPIYYLLIFIFIVLQHTPLYDPQAYIFERNIPAFYYFLFIQNFAMGAHGNFGPQALTPTWSLAVEEQFYLIIPLIVYFVKPRYLWIFIVLCLLVAPLCRLLSANWYQSYTLLPSRIDSPAIGFLIALLVRNDKSYNYFERNSRTLPFFLLFVMVVFMTTYIFKGPGVFNHTLLGLAFGIILIIVLFTKKGWVYTLLTSRPLLYLGTLSYFLYLYHQLISGILHLGLLGNKISKLGSSADYSVTILSALITWSLAYLSYRLIERPLIKFSHSYSY